MKGCLKFVVVGLLFLVGLSFARYYLILTPEERAVEQAKYVAEEEAEKQKDLEDEARDLRKKQDIQRREAEAMPLREAFLQEILSIPGMDEARFVDLRHLQIRLRQDPLLHLGEDHVRVICENAAKAWSARSGLTPVECEEWYGDKRYAVGAYTGPVPEQYLASIADKVVADQHAKDARALLSMEGKTLAEIEGTHGKATTKDAGTGWADWPAFRARFAGGKVVEVSVK